MVAELKSVGHKLHERSTREDSQLPMGAWRLLSVQYAITCHAGAGCHASTRVIATAEAQVWRKSTDTTSYLMHRWCPAAQLIM